MPSVDGMKAQLRAMLADQKSLIEDSSRPWSAKTAEFNDRETQMNAAIENIERYKGMDRNPLDDHGITGPAGSNSYSHSARIVGAAKALAGPPALRLSNDDAGRLFDAAKSGQSLTIEAKTTATESALGGAPTQYAPGFSPFLREPTRVADLFPSAQAVSSSVDYYVLTGGTAAAPVAEGALKPESTVAATLRTLPITKIAHWAGATSEVMADFPSFNQVLENELVAGLILAESAQILSGNGTAPNMLGVLNTPGILTRVVTAGSDPLVALAGAVAQLRSGASYANPTAIVMNPADLSAIQVLKSSGSGEFVAGSPFDSGPVSIWGVRVVQTTAMPAGTALAADFNSLGVLYSREGVTVKVDPYSLMTTNVVRVVVEERLAVAVVRPAAAIKVTGLNS